LWLRWSQASGVTLWVENVHIRWEDEWHNGCDEELDRLLAIRVEDQVNELPVIKRRSPAQDVLQLGCNQSRST
jgi:hypothetical protein